MKRKFHDACPSIYEPEQEDVIPLAKPNRDKLTAPKLGLYWCWKCDRGIMSVGGKCSQCGAKSKNKRRKK